MTRTVQFANSSSDSADNNRNVVVGSRGCCFWIPFLSRPSPPTSSSEPSPGESTGWGSIRGSDKTNSSTEGPWWSRGWQRFLEWSGHVAAPRWKAFLRKFSRSRMMMHRAGLQFRYDPLSYALNFDEGPGQNGEHDRDMLSRDFSSRYASIPASCKSSMDLGHSCPPFT